MKSLRDYIYESILGSSFEDDLDKAVSRDWIDDHWEVFFRGGSYSGDARWAGDGIDCGDSVVVWSQIIEHWKQGKEIPIASVDEFRDAGMFNGLDALPKNIGDFELLMNEILAKAVIKTLVLHAEDGMNQYKNIMCQHPGLQTLFLSTGELGVRLSHIQFNKVHASRIVLQYRKYLKHDEAPSKPLMDYKAITGWNGDTLIVDWTFGLVDVSKWRNGVSKTIEFNDENIEALDYLFSKNKFKELIVNCSFISDGSNNQCGQGPFNARITKSGSKYKYKFVGWKELQG